MSTAFLNLRTENVCHSLPILFPMILIPQYFPPCFTVWVTPEVHTHRAKNSNGSGFLGRCLKATPRKWRRSWGISTPILVSHWLWVLGDGVLIACFSWRWANRTSVTLEEAPKQKHADLGPWSRREHTEVMIWYDMIPRDVGGYW